MTFDIYTNRIPFGLLTEDEQAALKAHPGQWEWYNYADGWQPTNPQWAYSSIYRAVKPAPEPLWVAPEVWAVLDKKWQWAARDQDGQIWLYDSEPETSFDTWVFDGDDCMNANSIAPHLIRPGTVTWDQSLIQRPEGV